LWSFLSNPTGNRLDREDGIDLSEVLRLASGFRRLASYESTWRIRYESTWRIRKVRPAKGSARGGAVRRCTTEGNHCGRAVVYRRDRTGPTRREIHDGRDAASCAVLITGNIPAIAQDASPSRVINSCRAQLIPYAQCPGIAAGSPAWSLRIATTRGDGALHYIGAVHSRDPEREQFSSIRGSWRAFRPTIAFYEGPDRGVREDEGSTIAQLGESGYVRFLATRDGVKLARLEPDPKAEIAYLLERFTPEQVKLFFVVREAQRLREAEGSAKATSAGGPPICSSGPRSCPASAGSSRLWTNSTARTRPTGAARRSGGRRPAAGSIPY
jgi:hypothetical protein